MTQSADPRDARAALVRALRRIDADDIAALNVEDVYWLRLGRMRERVQLADGSTLIEFGSEGLLALAAWLKVRGTSRGPLLVSIHVDRVGQRRLTPDEIERIRRKPRTSPAAGGGVRPAALTGRRLGTLCRRGHAAPEDPTRSWRYRVGGCIECRLHAHHDAEPGRQQSTAHRLGRLCPKHPSAEDPSRSVRYARPPKACVECERERIAIIVDKRREARRTRPKHERSKE